MKNHLKTILFYLLLIGIIIAVVATIFSGTTEECLEKKLIERTFSVERFISDKNNRIFFS